MKGRWECTVRQKGGGTQDPPVPLRILALRPFPRAARTQEGEGQVREDQDETWKQS